jgi:hypothetical protein
MENAETNAAVLNSDLLPSSVVRMKSWHGAIRKALLVIIALCFFECILHRQSSFFRWLEAALCQTQSMLLICIVAWFSTILLERIS